MFEPCIHDVAVEHITTWVNDIIPHNEMERFNVLILRNGEDKRLITGVSVIWSLSKSSIKIIFILLWVNLFSWSSSSAWEHVGTRENTQHSEAKVGNSTRPNKSLHYAQTQCVFVGENHGGDNTSGFLPPTDFGEESRSTSSQGLRWTLLRVNYSKCETV